LLQCKTIFTHIIYIPLLLKNNSEEINKIFYFNPNLTTNYSLNRYKQEQLVNEIKPLTWLAFTVCLNTAVAVIITYRFGMTIAQALSMHVE